MDYNLQAVLFFNSFAGTTSILISLIEPNSKPSIFLLVIDMN